MVKVTKFGEEPPFELYCPRSVMMNDVTTE